MILNKKIKDTFVKTSQRDIFFLIISQLPVLIAAVYFDENVCLW